MSLIGLELDLLNAVGCNTSPTMELVCVVLVVQFVAPCRSLASHTRMRARRLLSPRFIVLLFLIRLRRELSAGPYRDRLADIAAMICWMRWAGLRTAAANQRAMEERGRMDGRTVEAEPLQMDNGLEGKTTARQRMLF